MVTVSVGVAVDRPYPRPAPGATADDDLSRRADEALYRAKEAGRNPVHIAAPGPGANVTG